MSSDSVKRLKSKSLMSLKMMLSAWSVLARMQSSDMSACSCEDSLESWFDAVLTARDLASVARVFPLLGWYTQSIALDRHRRQPFSSPEHLSYEQVSRLVSASRTEFASNVLVLCPGSRLAPRHTKRRRVFRNGDPVHTFLIRQFIHAFCTSGALRLCDI